MKLLLATLLLLYASVQLYAHSREEYYIKALELYNKENYKKALQQINQALFTDSANIGYLVLKGSKLTRLKRYNDV